MQEAMIHDGIDIMNVHLWWDTTAKMGIAINTRLWPACAWLPEITFMRICMHVCVSWHVCRPSRPPNITSGMILNSYDKCPVISQFQFIAIAVDIKNWRGPNN